ncbi:hypothetical protein MNBD_UNCLBAC01-1662 [hydrothermal vent metagenome]|uniref:HEPN domain-containing protein n=1 Tax=hydrothermal vent metagenome TaxID=652676 RepID=A0A3B1DRI9_9ZZZZ
MRSKRYADALFFCHLTIESRLKALVSLKIKKYPPLIHDLTKLTLLAKLELPEDKTINLAEITTFNIRARYDDYKFSFYKKATKTYAEQYFKASKEILSWIKKDILKNMPKKA